MVQTEQLTPDTLLIHMHGHFDQGAAKELGLLVFQSFHLGFRTYLLNLSGVPLLEEESTQALETIKGGLHVQGGTLQIIAPPSCSGNQLILRTTLQDLPQETWN